MEEFERWYRETHLPHVMEIPGIVRAYRSDWTRGSANWTALYEFADDDSVPEAVASPQAQVARQDWEGWAPPRTTYHHWNYRQRPAPRRPPRRRRPRSRAGRRCRRGTSAAATARATAP